MMRKVDDGTYTCAEHGGSFDKRAAFEHLLWSHEGIAHMAERILDANRAELPVNPTIKRFGFADAHGPNRAERRAAQRRARRKGK